MPVDTVSSVDYTYSRPLVVSMFHAACGFYISGSQLQFLEYFLHALSTRVQQLLTAQTLQLQR